MHAGYYQNTLYPLQDKVLRLIENLSVDFYLTGGTALSRAYLHHRYSDDLDFFVNEAKDFKNQIRIILDTLKSHGIATEIAVADESFVRLFIKEGDCSLKLDFINDVSYRKGEPLQTQLFVRTDTLENILSNKITALGRLMPKDVVDIVFICEELRFQWKEIMADASVKDIWVNPVETAQLLDGFPLRKLSEIIWIDKMPEAAIFDAKLKLIIRDILEGKQNSLCN